MSSRPNRWLLPCSASQAAADRAAGTWLAVGPVSVPYRCRPCVRPAASPAGPCRSPNRGRAGTACVLRQSAPPLRRFRAAGDELHRHLSRRDRQILAGADVDRHTFPSPAFDKQPYRDVGLGGRPRPYAGHVAVPVYCPRTTSLGSIGRTAFRRFARWSRMASDSSPVDGSMTMCATIWSK